MDAHTPDEALNQHQPYRLSWESGDPIAGRRVASLAALPEHRIARSNVG